MSIMLVSSVLVPEEKNILRIYFSHGGGGRKNRRGKYDEPPTRLRKEEKKVCRRLQFALGRTRRLVFILFNMLLSLETRFRWGMRAAIIFPAIRNGTYRVHTWS